MPQLSTSTSGWMQSLEQVGATSSAQKLSKACRAVQMNLDCFAEDKRKQKESLFLHVQPNPLKEICLDRSKLYHLTAVSQFPLQHNSLADF